MTNRVPYEVMAPVAEKIFQGVVAAHSQEEMATHYEKYADFIQGCGWTVAEYDSEQLKQMEASWDTTPKPN